MEGLWIISLIHYTFTLNAFCTPSIMIKNYLTIALRYIVRHKVFTLINVSGLTLGITCSLMIFLYIQDEVAYDRFHDDAERVYRLSV